MSDEPEVLDAPNTYDPIFEDPVAARAEAHRRMLETVAELEDTTLRDEGMKMLVAIRLSFKTLSSAALSSINGGKS